MRKQIIVYSDEGAGPVSLRFLVNSLKRLPFLEGYRIIRLGSKQLQETLWQEETSLIIFPGGRDVYYHESLKGAPNNIIRNFVESGGSFLGICAGGYYGCGSISFDKGGKLEVVGERELKFFPGLAQGPVYGKGLFRYGSESGARIAQLQWTESGEDFKSNYVSYFNGGCEFVNAANHDNVTILAKYEDVERCPAAIVECRVGEGKAILSGVHPEYDPIDFHQNDPYLQAIGLRLSKVDHLRKPLFEKLIGKLLS